MFIMMVVGAARARRHDRTWWLSHASARLIVQLRLARNARLNRSQNRDSRVMCICEGLSARAGTAT
jgi:hypothetical protein